MSIVGEIGLILNPKNILNVVQNSKKFHFLIVLLFNSDHCHCHFATLIPEFLGVQNILGENVLWVI